MSGWIESIDGISLATAVIPSPQFIPTPELIWPFRISQNGLKQSQPFSLPLADPYPRVPSDQACAPGIGWVTSCPRPFGALSAPTLDGDSWVRFPDFMTSAYVAEGTERSCSPQHLACSVSWVSSCKFSKEKKNSNYLISFPLGTMGELWWEEEMLKKIALPSSCALTVFEIQWWRRMWEGRRALEGGHIPRPTGLSSQLIIRYPQMIYINTISIPGVGELLAMAKSLWKNKDREQQTAQLVWREKEGLENK